MGPIGLVGWGAAGLVVALWLVISFSEPSSRRTLLEWAAHHATGRTLARSASLEDVFLKLTGRALDA